MNGGRSGIRTLEGLAAPPVFRTTIAFATKHALVCGLDFVFAIAQKSLRREPSSLYTLLALSQPSLGVASDLPRGFADFDSLHLPGFHDSARFNKTGAFNRSANLPYSERYHRTA